MVETMVKPRLFAHSLQNFRNSDRCDLIFDFSM